MVGNDGGRRKAAPNKTSTDKGINTMKLKTLTMAAAVMMLAAAAKAQVTTNSTITTTTTTSTGDHMWNNPDWWKYEKHPDGHLFNANELTLDAFGTYLNPERRIKSIFNTSIRKGTWGGGVGANYFWSRDVGLGVETSFQDGGAKFVDHVGGNLMVRFPFDVIRTAPYIMAGGGYKWNPRGSWFVDLGPGLEFRFNKHLGVFGDASYIFLDKVSPGGTKDQLYFRVGLRAGF
jgi:hypothetical protein